MKIIENVTDYMMSVAVTRSIAYGNHGGKTVLMLEINDLEQPVGGSAIFDGKTSSFSRESVEELRRFKALLNSFEEL